MIMKSRRKMERIQCLRLGILDWNTRRIIGVRFIFFTFDTDIIMV